MLEGGYVKSRLGGAERDESDDELPKVVHEGSLFCIGGYDEPVEEA